MNLLLPTSLHHEVLDIVYSFFHAKTAVDTVLVINSCARGEATPESDLDIAVLVAPNTSQIEMDLLENEWQRFASTHDRVQAFCQLSPFTGVHLDVINGRYQPALWDDGGGPDEFELEIGNHIAYSKPIYECGSYFEALKNEWLPYYGNDLQAQRAEMVKNACLYDLAYIPFLVERNLLFQAFSRLYKAQQEFIQWLLIKHRQYPIAYNKWLEKQIVEWLKKPDLCRELKEILSIDQFEGQVFIKNGERLKKLLLNEVNERDDTRNL